MVNRVLVSGGAGFNVVVLDDFSGKPNFCLIEGGFRNKADVKKALTNVDVILHLVAIVSVDSFI